MKCRTHLEIEMRIVEIGRGKNVEQCDQCIKEQNDRLVGAYGRPMPITVPQPAAPREESAREKREAQSAWDAHMRQESDRIDGTWKDTGERVSAAQHLASYIVQRLAETQEVVTSESAVLDAIEMANKYRGLCVSYAIPSPAARGEDLKEFANKVCRDIPDGWGLALHLENGSGDFTLTDTYGRDIHYEEYTNVDCSLAERGIAALAYAIQIEREARGE